MKSSARLVKSSATTDPPLTKMLRRLLLLLSLLAVPAAAQVDVSAHRAAADRLIDAATRDSAAHKRLATLADNFGHRFSGSASLEQALDWIMAEMKKDGLENVHGERVMVTHWVRGAESAELVAPRATFPRPRSPSRTRRCCSACRIAVNAWSSASR